MGGQAEAWADWCRNNTRVGPAFTNEEFYQRSSTKPLKSPAQAAAAVPVQAQKPPFRDLSELVSETGNSDLLYLLQLEQVAAKPLPVLCAMIEEDRPAFLEFLRTAGVEQVSHRQQFTNALTRGLREGRVLRGWVTAETAAWERECATCHKQASESLRLSTCARCKSVKYCSVSCQKAAWPGHKSLCQVIVLIDCILYCKPVLPQRISR